MVVEPADRVLAQGRAAAEVRPSSAADAPWHALHIKEAFAAVSGRVEGLSTEETAAAMEMSPNAVKTRLHRARQALRALLEPHFSTPEAL